MKAYMYKSICESQLHFYTPVSKIKALKINILFVHFKNKTYVRPLWIKV